MVEGRREPQVEVGARPNEELGQSGKHPGCARRKGIGNAESAVEIHCESWRAGAGGILMTDAKAETCEPREVKHGCKAAVLLWEHAAVVFDWEQHRE
jgi:hypothetical protein